MTNEARLKAEMSVVRAAVKAAINSGFFVTVYDGGKYVIIKSHKLKEIIDAMRSTFEDKILFHNKDGKCIGSMYFVYGNEPYEVINDYSDNDTVGEIYNAAQIVADRIEAGC